MKTIFLLILFSCSVLFITGQNTDSITIKKNDKGIVEYVKFPSLQSSESKKVAIPETANEFFAEYLKPTPSTTFILQPQKQRNKDFRHEHYNQYYNGVKVDGAGYNFHFEKGRMYLAHGNYLKIEGLNTSPSISKEEAKQAFASYKEIPVAEVTGFMADLLIKEISKISGKDTVYTLVLVYRIYLITGHPNNDEVGYIDVQSGKVLATEPSMTGYSATGTFETRYNGTRQATTQYYNNTYNLCDSSRNAVIHTWDLNGRTNIDSGVELTDADNDWTAAEYASNEDDMGLDIHWALQKIYDYLDNEHNINSYDNPASGNGFDIDAYFHFGVQDFAGWNFVANLLVFGDGATLYRPIASLDAVAHEYGHGITDFQIGWGNTGDPYAFNEGMSDIWAAILEYRVSPNSIWEITEEITLNYDCLRNIQTPDDPNARVQIADTYLSDYYNDDSNPNLVPYIKGGVFSHWFYLLENGGLGTNDIDNDYTVYELGMDATEALVVDAVFNNYLDNTTTYPQVRTAMLSAANTLFGTNSFHSLQVVNAWYAVGVGSNPGQVSLSGSNVICNAGTVITANNSPTGSTISWTCSNNLQVYSGGSTSTPTFKPLYTSSGGNGWVQVHYTSNGYTAAGPKKYVGVNQPYSYDLHFGLYTSGGTPITYMCPNTYYHIYLTNEGGCSLSNYSWTIPAGWDYMYQSGNMVSVYTNSSPGGRVEVDATTCCGINTTVFIGYLYDGYCGSMYSMILSPNPTSGETILSVEPISEDTEFDIDEEWDLEIYNNTQMLKEKKTKLKGNEYRFNTSNWKEGVYMVRVTYKDEILTGKLVVTR